MASSKHDNKSQALKPKPQKITASSVATTKFLKPSVQPISTPLLAPAGGVQAPEVQPVNLAPLQGHLENPHLRPATRCYQYAH